MAGASPQPKTGPSRQADQDHGGPALIAAGLEAAGDGPFVLEPQIERQKIQFHGGKNNRNARRLQAGGNSVMLSEGRAGSPSPPPAVQLFPLHRRSMSAALPLSHPPLRMSEHGTVIVVSATLRAWDTDHVLRLLLPCRPPPTVQFKDKASVSGTILAEQERS